MHVPVATAVCVLYVLMKHTYAYTPQFHLEPAVNASFGYVFPAIRGIQAGREYYISMCPLRLIPKIFQFDEIELRPELRAQRVLNKARIPEMIRYLVNNTKSYVFSAITASVDAEVEFESIGVGRDGEKVGQLHIPMDARFVINDGQHRRAAIEEAIKENPELGDETIGVVFFLDSGLERCQQMFADLNRYAIRPSTSIGVLYDHRDELAILTKQMVHQSPVFRDLVEMEKTTLAPRSRRLFTLSALYSGNRALLQKSDADDLESKTTLAGRFWETAAGQFPEWMAVREGRTTAGDVRRDFIHSHGVVLQALGRAGSGLIRKCPRAWPVRLRQLASLDWSRTNVELWEGRAIIGGRVQKGSQNVTLTANAIKARPQGASRTRGASSRGRIRTPKP